MTSCVRSTTDRHNNILIHTTTTGLRMTTIQLHIV